MKKVISIVVSLLILCLAVAAQGTAPYGTKPDYSAVSPQVLQLERQFLLGDIHQKVKALESSSTVREEAASLYTDALNFVCDYAALLQNEAGMKELTVASVLYSPYAIGDVSVQLLQIFSLWDAPVTSAVWNNQVEVQAAVLDAFANLEYYGYESAAVFNAYAQKLLTAENPDYELMEKCLRTLNVIGEASSFDIYFSYYFLPEIEETVGLREIARNALVSVREEHLAWFSAMIDSGTASYQLAALKFILENKEFSDFFRAEMAEKALSNAIFIAEETDTFCDDDVALQLLAVEELRRLSWTRASSLIQRLFPVAVGEFENGYLSDEDFISIISSVQELSSLRAGVLLSDLLKKMNTRAEKGDFCSEPLVLAVIQSLGTLGDKIAFDSLLYVSYLPYSESVIEASRDALARLKW